MRNNIYGVVTKPLFDENVFKVKQAVHVVDYNTATEYNAIIVEVAPLFIDVLTYDATTSKAIFCTITIEGFVEGSFEIKALVEMDLKEAHLSETEVNEVIEQALDLEESGDIEMQETSNNDFCDIEYSDREEESLEVIPSVIDIDDSFISIVEEDTVVSEFSASKIDNYRRS